MQFKHVEKDPLSEKKLEAGSLKAVDLNMPSGCCDYPAPAQGTFQILPPRVKEVEFIAGMNDKNYDDQLTRLIKSLLVAPVMMDPWDFTLGDRQFLHTWVRAQIDPFYTFDAVCPKCGKMNKAHKLLIPEIPVNNVPEEYRPNMRLQLPRSQQIVTVRLETARDRLRSVDLQQKGFTDWVTRKALVVTSVNGNKMDPEARCAWLRELPAGDDLFLGEYLKWQAHGPDFANCSFACKECQQDSVLRIPFRLEFYMPTVHAAAVFADAVRGSGELVDGGGVSGDAGDQGDGVRGVRVGS